MFTQDTLPLWGASGFGAILGWLAYHVFKSAEKLDVRWLGSLVGVLGGGAVTALFDRKDEMFGAYAVGLALSFFVAVLTLPIVKALADEMRADAKKAKSKIKPSQPSVTTTMDVTPTAAQESRQP